MRKKKDKLYRCDPDKNTKCKKYWCYRNNNGQFCRHVVNKKEYRMVNPFKRIYEWFKYKYKK